MTQLIPLHSQTIDGNAVETVNAKELHEFLEVRSKFADWIKNRISEYDFTVNQDFTTVSKNLENGGRSIVRFHKKMEANNATLIEYAISLDMAKELSMVERNEQGKQARQYFIECEKKQAQALKALSNIALDLSSNLVIYKDDDFYLSSLSIAKELGKRHSDILRDIEREISQLKSASADFSVILEGFKEITYLDKQGKPRKAYELNEIASYQILLRYSPKHRAIFLLQFKVMKDTILNMFKLKVIDSVLPEYKGKKSYVYIIKNLDSGNLKIGVGSDPVKRLKQLQTGSDSELSLVYTSFLCSNAFSLENDVHNRFKEFHVRGEWFKLSEKEIINYLEKQKYVLNSDLDLSFDSRLVRMLEVNVNG